jgi:FkbM family methyltransferase
LTEPTPQPAFGTYAPSPWVKLLLALSRHTLLGRGQARRWIASLLRKAHEGPLDSRLWGHPARIHIGANNNEIKALLNPGRFNRSELDIMRRHLPRQGGVFVDIGANVGMVSLAARAHMARGTIVSIEPQPAMFQRLEFNLKGAGPAGGVSHILVQAAIGPRAGRATLAVPDQPGMASLAAGLPDATNTVDVDVVTLAGLAREAELEAIDVLKIDVEGYEDEALLPHFEAAPETLWPRIVIMEHCHAHRWSRDAIAVLADLGYSEIRRDRQNVCLERGAP